METGKVRWSWRVAAVGVSALALAASAVAGNASSAAAGNASSHSTYKRVNLVSDVPGRAQVTDPNLVNAWGASYGPGTPLWVSDAGADVSTLYQGGIHGGPQTILDLVVNIPGGEPTGQAFNPTNDFVVHGSDGSSGVARFLFVGETGHLTGWAPNVPATSPPPSTEAQDAVVTPGANYKGLAFGQTQSGPRLFAANFSAGTVDVYNGIFQRVITEGNFEDRQLPPRFAPFNVGVLNGKVYVAYAKQDAEKEDEVAGRGLGRVDVFNFDGELLRRLPQHGSLNAPWGLTIAPAGFGEFSGDLLVGNFGDGRIHAYNPTTLRLLGAVRNRHHDPVTIDGLWALIPGNGVEGGTDEILFTAGPNDETHGLLGSLSVRH